MEIFSQKNIVLNCEISTKGELLEFFAKEVVSLKYGDDLEMIAEGFANREKEFETSLGEGFAIPHTKSNYINYPGVLFVKTTQEIQWSDEEKASIFIVLFTPEEKGGNTHLKMLASLSRKLINQDFKKMLKQSQNVSELYNEICSALEN